MMTDAGIIAKPSGIVDKRSSLLGGDCASTSHQNLSVEPSNNYENENIPDDNFVRTNECNFHGDNNVNNEEDDVFPIMSMNEEPHPGDEVTILFYKVIKLNSPNASP